MSDSETSGSAAIDPQTDKNVPQTDDGAESVKISTSDSPDASDPISDDSEPSKYTPPALAGLVFSDDTPGSDGADYADDILASVLDEDNTQLLNQAYNFLRNGAILSGADWGIWKAFLQAKPGKFVPSKEFVHSYLINHRSDIEKSSDFHINDYDEVSGDKYLGFVDAVEKKYNELKDRKPLTAGKFNETLELYKDSYQASKTAEILQQGLNALTDGIKVRGKKIQGSQASQEYIRAELAKLTATMDYTKGGGYLSAQEVEDMYEKDDALATKHILDLAGLPTFNENTGGLKTRTLVTILAPEKSGKTKFCARLMHTALVSGVNASVLSLEDGAYEFETQVRACHFDYVYNTGKDLQDRKLGVSADTIISKSFKSKEIEDLERASSIDMKDSSNGYGSLEYIDVDSVDSSNIIDVIEESIRHNDSQMVVIDYPQLLGWQSIYTSQREMLEEVYKKLLQCAKRNNVCIVTPAQMTQEALKNIAKNGVNNTELRTSAGGSYEITKSADVIFALYGSVQDIESGNLQLISLPSRRNPPFGTINMHVDFASCSFIELKGQR